MEGISLHSVIAVRPFGVEVQHPWVLLGLLLLIPAVWLAWASRSAGPRWRDLTSTILRVLAIVALVAALADTRVVRESDKFCVTIVLDESRSINPADRARAIATVKRGLRKAGASDRYAVIGFGGESVLQLLPTTGGSIPKMQGRFRREFTDIGQAIRLALSIAPQDAAHRILLISDGNDTVADSTAVAAAAAARQAGTPIDTCTIGSATTGDLWVERLLIDSQKSVDDPFSVKAVIHSDAERNVRLTMTCRGRLVDLEGRGERSYRTVHLEKGPNLVRVSEHPQRQQAGGMYDYTVAVEADGDPEPSNNHATGIIRIHGEPRVLIVDGSDGRTQGRHLLDALIDADIQAKLVGPSGFPTTMTQFNYQDCVVLSNVAADDRTGLSLHQMALAKQWVETGGGLIWIGGENSFGPGGYGGTDIEKLSPVSCDMERSIDRASLALVIAVDMSGSMEMPVTRKMTKMDLANAGAIEAIKRLGERDKAGVVMVDTAYKWVERPHIMAMTSGSKTRLINSVRSARPGGGGIFCYTALEASLVALAKTEAMSKHIILFGDTNDCEQQSGCERLVAKARAAGVTVSTIGLGLDTDSDAEFLRRIAKVGGGKSYFTDDPRKLPRLFIRDVYLVSRNAFIEPKGGITPAVVGHARLDPILRGLGAAPRLRGQVATTLKPRATLLMHGPKPEDPLLAKWRFGLGRAVAWTSDAQGKWAPDWVAWDGFGKFWSQTVRWTMRNSGLDSPVTADAVIRGQRGVIIAEAIDKEGKPITDLSLKGVVQGDENSAAREVELRQVSPGRYEGQFAAKDAGAYFVAVVDASNDGQVLDLTGAVSSSAQEFLRLQPNRPLMGQLAAVSGGRSLSITAVGDEDALTAPDVEGAQAIAGLFVRPEGAVYTYKPVAHTLLAVAMFLFFGDIVVRRFALPDRIVRWLTPARRHQGDQAVLGRLRDRRDAFRRDKTAPVAVGDIAGRPAPPPPPLYDPADTGRDPAPGDPNPAVRPGAAPKTSGGPGPAAGNLADRLRAAKRRAQEEMIEKSQRDR